MKLDAIDFLIIGATKAATTWLQRSLQLDSAVYMPNPELHFFSREFDRGEAWYVDQFKPHSGSAFIGEKSNSYLEYPAAAARIRSALPAVRLIAQLRNPVERAYSDYCMLYRRGEVSADIARYLDVRHAEELRFLSGGLYFARLQPYFDQFPSDRILLLLYEDMKTDPDKHITMVRDHLGLPTTSPAPRIEEKVKDRTAAIVNPTLRRWLRPIKPLIASVRGTRPLRALHGLIARPTIYPPLTGDLRHRLADYYAEDSRKLADLMKRDLSLWSEGALTVLDG